METPNKPKKRKGRHLSNIYPNEKYLQLVYHEWREDPQRAHELAVQRHRKWLKGKIISKPKGTRHFGVRELLRRGMIGVYAPTNENRYAHANKRLEYLRQELRAERTSYGELAELQSLVEYIQPGDTELLEAASVPEN
jgi:hypothetical protein